MHMAQSKQLAWAELRVGIFVLLGIALIIVGVFYVTGGSAFTSRYRLVTYLPEVDGLGLGAPVSLDGLVIGNVDGITLAPPPPGQTADPNRSIAVRMRVDRNFQEYIRSDSQANLITEGFLGNRLVSLKRGYTGRVLQEGEQITGVEEKAMKQIVERGADLMQNMNALSTQVGEMVDAVNRGEGTLGKLLVDDSIYNRANATLDRVEQMTAAIQSGQGTIGKLLTSDTLYTKAESAIGGVDNIVAAIQQQKGSLGKMVYDPAFHDSATQLMANTNNLMGDVRAGRGTLGKLATDDTLFTAWRQTGANLQDATAKLNSNNTTAGKFFSDPQFYDTLTGLMGDMRLLVGDFRTNPGKFLRVKVSLF
jgi:phospholipid/cholesterol/gamma-HCH transport system substrate-binding protein